MSKFWQKKYISKYSGAEIDAAVAKADTVPAVTVEDAGKALVVDEEGNIVSGSIYPTFELSETEWSEVSTALGTFLYSLSAADGLVYKTFTIETNAATVIEKLKAVINSGALCVYDKLPSGYGGGILLGITSINGFVTLPITVRMPAPISKNILMSFEMAIGAGETSVAFRVTAQVVTAAS